MSLEVCPICRSITEQDIISSHSNFDNIAKGIESEMHVSVCRQCNNEIEQEVILMNSINPQREYCINC